jgi:hypothetical protein
MVPIHIHSLGLDEANRQPVVLLREDDGLRVVPIWIGHPEAMAIMLAVQGVEAPRPLTHDLLLSVVTAADRVVERVEITRVEGGTFFASIVLRGEGGTVTVDSRPSDALALAVRAGCPIFADEAVLAEAGGVPEQEAEEEVAEFRDFLKHVTPEDFGSNS